MHLIELIEKNTITIIDLETTGLNCKNDHIIDIGAVKIKGWKKGKSGEGEDMMKRGNIIGSYSSFVRCPVKLPRYIADLTGISDTDLKDAPPIGVALKELKEFIEESILVGHNVGFDYGFLSEHGRKCAISFENRKIDTISIAKTIFRDKVKSYRLSELTKLFGIEYTPHRAFNDAFATTQLFFELARRDDEAHCSY